jgi:hypothetical protein
MISNVETVDRTIFEMLRIKFTEAGLIPDYVNYTGTDAQNKARFKLERDALIASTGMVDMFGVGNSEHMGEETFNRIVIIRRDILIGGVTSQNAYFFDLAPTTGVQNSYIKSTYPNETATIDYDIRLLSENTKFERIIQNITYKAIGSNGFKPSYNKVTGKLDGEDISISQIGYVNMNRVGAIEYSFRLQVSDVYINEPEVVEVVPMITSIPYSVGDGETFSIITNIP